MAQSSFPQDVMLETLLGRAQIRFYLDSFNEMPRERFESLEYVQDFNSFFERIGKNTVIIASRTKEGLQKFNVPFLRLDDIALSYLTNELDKRRIQISERFSREVLALLQKPLLYHLFFNIKDIPEKLNHPIQLYQFYFNEISNELAKYAHSQIFVDDMLTPIAYHAIDSGQESFSLETLRENVVTPQNWTGV